MDKHLRKILGGEIFHNTSSVRSRTMSAIKYKNNKSTEQVLQMSLVRAGISGWKRNVKAIPGNPDFVFPSGRLVIFVDGCFWHYCARCGHIPKTRSVFWETKLEATKARDRRNTRKLRDLGYRVVRIWEHQLRKPQDIDRTINRILTALAAS